MIQGGDPNSKACILEFAKDTAALIYDLIDSNGFEFRLLQCGGMLYECAVVRANIDEEDSPLEDRLRDIGFSQYCKAFGLQEDLEWFLKLRTEYFSLLANVLRDVVFNTDEDTDGKYALPRKVLTTASALASQEKLHDDLASLDLHLSSDPEADASTRARTGITDAWAFVLQRSVECELPDAVPLERTENQWRQLRQTHFMNLKSMSVTALRKLITTEFPSATAPTGNKESLVSFITDQRILAAKASETEAIARAQAENTSTISDKIRGIDGPSRDAVIAGWRFLSKGLSEAQSCTCVDDTARALVMRTCDTFTAALAQLSDTGLGCLVFKRAEKSDVGNNDKFGNLSAMQTSTATEIKLYFRGVVTPTSNVDSYASQAVPTFLLPT